MTTEAHLNGDPVDRRIRVHVVAMPMVLWGLVRLIKTSDALMHVTHEGASMAASLEAMASTPADVVVVDLDGDEEVRKIENYQRFKGVKVLVITGEKDHQARDAAVLAGARGVLDKRESPQTLLKAVEKVHMGEIWIDRNATGRLFDELTKAKQPPEVDPERQKIEMLTRRERQTIRALVEAPSAKSLEIAQRLCISEHTLRNHISSIYSKLELTNRVDLFAFANRYQQDFMRYGN